MIDLRNLFFVPVKVTLTVKHIANNQHVLINMFSDLKRMQLHTFFFIYMILILKPHSASLPCLVYF